MLIIIALIVIGIITAKKTKTLKNGDTMAFLVVEDRVAEIEIIVFAKQYKRFSSEVVTENAVLIKGSLSFEDGDEVRILLSEMERLKSNTEYEDSARANAAETVAPVAPTPTTVYVKLDTIADKRVATITRMALLNPGKARVVVYDSTTGKYSAMKDTSIDPSEKVINKLRDIFGQNDVVLR